MEYIVIDGGGKKVSKKKAAEIIRRTDAFYEKLYSGNNHKFNRILYKLSGIKADYKAIDDANVNSMKDLKQDYKLLKFKIGKIPSMMDFVKSGDRDPYSFVMNKSCGSYYGFLCKVESETLLPLAKDYMQRLYFFSVEICNGKRLAEL